MMIEVTKEPERRESFRRESEKRKKEMMKKRVPEKPAKESKVKRSFKFNFWNRDMGRRKDEEAKRIAKEEEDEKKS